MELRNINVNSFNTLVQLLWTINRSDVHKNLMNCSVKQNTQYILCVVYWIIGCRFIVDIENLQILVLLQFYMDKSVLYVLYVRVLASKGPVIYYRRGDLVESTCRGVQENHLRHQGRQKERNWSVGQRQMGLGKCSIPVYLVFSDFFRLICSLSVLRI